MPDFKCKRCGYLWDSRVTEPKACPKCKRVDWNRDYANRVEMEARIKFLEARVKELESIIKNYETPSVTN